MAEPETGTEHFLNDEGTGHGSVLEPSEPKRQKLGEPNDTPWRPQLMISVEQEFCTAVVEPPDINYRWILNQDMEAIEHL